MHPRATTYRLARTGRDYQQAHALLREAGGPEQPLRFPTVLAEREGVLVGLVSVGLSPDRYLLVGPLVVHPQVRPQVFVAMRLLEGLEYCLQQAGIRSYLFTVEVGKDHWMQALAKLDMQPYTVQSGHAWYQRTVAGGTHGQYEDQRTHPAPAGADGRGAAPGAD